MKAVQINETEWFVPERGGLFEQRLDDGEMFDRWRRVLAAIGQLRGAIDQRPKAGFSRDEIKRIAEKNRNEPLPDVEPCPFCGHATTICFYSRYYIACLECPYQSGSCDWDRNETIRQHNAYDLLVKAKMDEGGGGH